MSSSPSTKRKFIFILKISLALERFLLKFVLMFTSLCTKLNDIFIFPYQTTFIIIFPLLVLQQDTRPEKWIHATGVIYIICSTTILNTFSAYSGGEADAAAGDSLDDDDLLVQDDSISLLIIVSITYRLHTVDNNGNQQFRMMIVIFHSAPDFLFCDGNIPSELKSHEWCKLLNKEDEKVLSISHHYSTLIQSLRDHHTRDKWLNHEERKIWEIFHFHFSAFLNFEPWKISKICGINEINFSRSLLFCIEQE